MTDNTNPKWWLDKGLRKMMLDCFVVYAASFTFGVSAPRSIKDFQESLVDISTMERS
jgi:hypothetical protein